MYRYRMVSATHCREVNDFRGQIIFRQPLRAVDPRSQRCVSNTVKLWRYIFMIRVFRKMSVNELNTVTATIWLQQYHKTFESVNYESVIYFLFL